MEVNSVAVLIAVYKDVEALSLILESLLEQTVVPDEIIVAEDGEYDAIARCIESFDNSKIKHTKQHDDGWKRNKSVNNALKVLESDYVIFIDGDCIPYPDFVEAHLNLAEKNTVLCGRRTEPGEIFSSKIRKRELTTKRFVQTYISRFFALKKDHIRHYEEGIFFNYRSFLYRFFVKYFRKDAHIVGCCWSAWRRDLEMINGFDEDFKLPTTGEDTDIERRLRHFGVRMKSCRNVANVIHLYHKKVFNPEITAKTEKLMSEKADIFVCHNGLNKLQ